MQRKVEPFQSPPLYKTNDLSIKKKENHCNTEYHETNQARKNYVTKHVQMKIHSIYVNALWHYY